MICWVQCKDVWCIKLLVTIRINKHTVLGAKIGSVIFSYFIWLGKQKSFLFLFNTKFGVNFIRDLWT
jgi:hypothetical protein